MTSLTMAVAVAVEDWQRIWEMCRRSGTTNGDNATPFSGFESVEPGCVWQHPMDPCCNSSSHGEPTDGGAWSGISITTYLAGEEWLTRLDHHSPQPSDWEAKSLGIVAALCRLRCPRLSHISRLFNGNLLLESPQYSGQLCGVCIWCRWITPSKFESWKNKKSKNIC